MIIAKGLEQKGYAITTDKENTDLCIINTCTVTGQSDAKCRQLIRSVQNKNPAAKIAVVGCFSEVASNQILEIGGIHLIIGNEEKLRLHEYVEGLENANSPIVITTPISNKPFTIETLGQFPGSTRANVKIQDGCDFLCSYCIIPVARGRSRSREKNDILREVKELASSGVREIILTGVNIGTYYFENEGLIQLIDTLNEVSGIERLRISSIEPTTIGNEVFSRMNDGQHILVPYLHLPLQSANNGILEKMRRHYQYEEYRDFVVQCFEEVNNVCIGSDILAGFPGESEDDFCDTVEKLNELPIHYFHVFPYAERPGTRSVAIQNKISPQSIARRTATLRALSDSKKGDYYKKQEGKVLNVLFEENEGGSDWYGYSDNYVRVMTQSKTSLTNQIKPIQITNSNPQFTTGNLSSSQPSVCD